MFSPVEYPDATSNLVVIRVVRDQPTGDGTCDSASAFECDNRSVIYHSNTIRTEVTVILPPPPAKEKKPRPIRKPEHQAPLREIQSPWQAKWRLTQQRPRDGLR